MRIPDAIDAAKAIQRETSVLLGPPEEPVVASDPHALVPRVLFVGTRGYLVKISNQANGAFSQGWYDAAAFMMRRLLETLIIEAFENKDRSNEIKNKEGDYLYLRDLISAALRCDAWVLSRNTKRALPHLKDVGDKSAHSRRFNAIKSDILDLKGDFRTVCEEFLYLANLR